MTRVTVVVPRHHSADGGKVSAAYSQELFAGCSSSSSSHAEQQQQQQQKKRQQPSFGYSILPVWQSRVLWNALVPCLFSADSKTAASLLTLILEQQFATVVVQQQQQHTPKTDDLQHTPKTDDLQLAATAATAAAVKSCSLFVTASLANGENTKAIQDADNDRPRNKEDSSLSSALTVKGQRREEETSSLTKQRRHRLIMKRKLRVFLKNNTNIITENTIPEHILLWIQPPTYSTIDFAFLGRVLTWEHTLLRTQSLTGYISTLGGGFFMCRHYQTAVWLAVEQERMALTLNDQSMYYKCRINAAYNYVYAGKFQMARQLIQEVLQSAVKLQPPDPVLVNMCHSARLFCRRVQKASRKLLLLPPKMDETTACCSYKEASAARHKGKDCSLTVDDFARIRVFQDQSRQDDLIIPFGHHHIVHKDDGADVE